MPLWANGILPRQVVRVPGLFAAAHVPRPTLRSCFIWALYPFFLLGRIGGFLGLLRRFAGHYADCFVCSAVLAASSCVLACATALWELRRSVLRSCIYNRCR